MSNLQDKLEKVPDPKKHQAISFIKSGIRILSSLLALLAISEIAIAVCILALGYGVAEMIGIYEELV